MDENLTTEKIDITEEAIVVTTPTVGECKFGTLRVYHDGTVNLSVADYRVKTVDDLITLSKLFSLTIKAAQK